ncbi:hypothetical protein BEWA_034120 [Theileria equi strain WA]|uniref:Uncharacterized protein n=1 Tax=Theileria equi strain WA TaxID=1537102 RepID=L0AYB3_THEEQ|nr:hypothetical protein BEWA_034120 [Theileria equi strain WA]AFZ80555.1 hypothetical protein BEWA_034120 [Theileria equi strain WA]|eukprot:XP_004830221.1 hypothetical protein BEWA_034120 [Theileria equi strain WA]
MVTFNGSKRKHGLYHHSTVDFFKTYWGPVKRSPFVEQFSLLKWLKGTITPEEMLPPKDQYKKNCWGNEKPLNTILHYQQNEPLFLTPALEANDTKIRDYIYNILEPSYRRPFSGIGMEATKMDHKLFTPLTDMVHEENMKTLPQINFQHNYISRIRRLERLISAAPTWTRSSDSSETSNNPFPYVRETESLVRPLNLHEILYLRSNHRLNRKSHPKWYVTRYLKYVQKRKRIKQIRQLILEARMRRA